MSVAAPPRNARHSRVGIDACGLKVTKFNLCLTPFLGLEPGERHVAGWDISPGSEGPLSVGGSVTDSRRHDEWCVGHAENQSDDRSGHERPEAWVVAKRREVFVGRCELLVRGPGCEGLGQRLERFFLAAE